MMEEISAIEQAIEDILEVREIDGDNPRTILVLEGHTDGEAYKWLVDRNKCHIVIAGSKDKVLAILAVLEARGITGVLAIIDADFMVLDGSQPESPNLFLTDKHDLEMMLISSVALEKALSEFGSVKKIDFIVQSRGKDIRTLLIECALPLGCLRWLSLRENWGLKFEGLDFEKFIDKATLQIDAKKMVRYVRSYTASTSGLSKPQLTESDIFAQLQQLMSESHDPCHICCGHDVATILALGLRKALGTNNTIEPDHLERCLRLPYHDSYFSQTVLYAALRTWEQTNRPFALLGDAWLIAAQQQLANGTI